MEAEEEDEEPLYAVPRKEHLPRFTLDDFVLHKMLGKGSFGKVSVGVKTTPTETKSRPRMYMSKKITTKKKQMTSNFKVQVFFPIKT